jgi:hypothetical protein
MKNTTSTNNANKLSGKAALATGARLTLDGGFTA